jgi:hypothetical protein
MPRIRKSDDALRIIWAEVYAPDRPDSDGEFMTAKTIREMAHNFLRAGKTKMVDVEHDNKDYPGVEVVESFTAQKGDPNFIEDSWVVAVHIPDDELWGKVKSGEINGFSVEAMVNKEERDVEIEVPPVVTGVTTQEEGHAHKFSAEYDENAKFLGGVTDAGPDGHFHRISRGTATDQSNGHSHRFSAIDQIKIVSA